MLFQVNRLEYANLFCKTELITHTNEFINTEQRFQFIEAEVSEPLIRVKATYKTE